MWNWIDTGKAEKDSSGAGVESPSPAQKQFSLRDVLTVTTGRLLTQPKGERDNGIGNLYELLNWITSDNLYTHQLPRAEDACRPWLIKCFPELAGASDYLYKLEELLAINRGRGQEAINSWLSHLKTRYPDIKETYDVTPMPGGWVHIDPLTEAESMIGRERMIVLNAPEREAET